MSRHVIFLTHLLLLEREIRRKRWEEALNRCIEWTKEDAEQEGMSRICCCH